jgi:hypothetical protein
MVPAAAGAADWAIDVEGFQHCLHQLVLDGDELLKL